MSNKCEHNSAKVLAGYKGFAVLHCTWGCGADLIELDLGTHEVATYTAAELQQLRAENARLREAAVNAERVLRQIANDEYCDNDGRGCGSSRVADETADALAAALKEQK